MKTSSPFYNFVARNGISTTLFQFLFNVSSIYLSSKNLSPSLFVFVTTSLLLASVFNSSLIMAMPSKESISDQFSFFSSFCLARCLSSLIVYSIGLLVSIFKQHYSIYFVFVFMFGFCIHCGIGSHGFNRVFDLHKLRYRLAASNAIGLVALLLLQRLNLSDILLLIYLSPLLIQFMFSVLTTAKQFTTKPEYKSAFSVLAINTSQLPYVIAISYLANLIATTPDFKNQQYLFTADRISSFAASFVCTSVLFSSPTIKNKLFNCLSLKKFRIIMPILVALGYYTSKTQAMHIETNGIDLIHYLNFLVVSLFCFFVNVLGGLVTQKIVMFRKNVVLALGFFSSAFGVLFASASKGTTMLVIMAFYAGSGTVIFFMNELYGVNYVVQD